MTGTKEVSREKGAKPTPGPWRIVTRERLGPLPFGVERAHANVVEPICDIMAYGQENDATLDRMDANARLIAAAPELLEACKRALPYLRSHVAATAGDMDGLDGDIGDRLAYDACEAALAKAEGE